MKKIETNYGANKFTVTQKMFDLWYEMFSHYDPNGFKLAVEEYMRTSEFPPNIAGINNIYQKLSDSREHLKNILMARYKWVAYWLEESPNKDSYRAFVNYVCKFPMNEREKVADELAYKMVAYWNNCAERGVPKQARFNVKEYIEDLNNEC